MAAEFASLDNSGQTIPTSGASASSMSLTTPNSMITGTMAGLQQIGSPSLTVDSVKNLITVKPISTANTQILRYGQVATGYLGMAVNDGTNDTMFAGRDNTGATVVKIAKTGFDAKTATGNNLIFNSSQDTFKIVLTQTTSLVVPDPLTTGATSTATIAHGLNFAPAILAFLTGSSVSSSFTPGMNYALPTINGGKFGAATYQPGLVISYRVDSTNIYFDVSNYTTTGIASIGTLMFRYYLLQETAT